MSTEGKLVRSIRRLAAKSEKKPEAHESRVLVVGAVDHMVPDFVGRLVARVGLNYVPEVTTNGGITETTFTFNRSKFTIIDRGPRKGDTKLSVDLVLFLTSVDLFVPTMPTSPRSASSPKIVVTKKSSSTRDLPPKRTASQSSANATTTTTTPADSPRRSKRKASTGSDQVVKKAGSKASAKSSNSTPPAENEDTQQGDDLTVAVTRRVSISISKKQVKAMGTHLEISKKLWKSVCEDYKDTPLVLVFDKCDVLRSRITATSLSEIYPSYADFAASASGADDFEKTCQFFTEEFNKLAGGKSFLTELTCASDSDICKKLYALCDNIWEKGQSL